MHNAVMCALSLYDVIGTTRHLHVKIKSFSNIAQPLHKEAVRGCSFLYIIAKKSVIMSEAFLVDVSICHTTLIACNWSTNSYMLSDILSPISDSSCKSCLIRVYSVCLWKYDISDHTLVDLTSILGHRGSKKRWI